MVYNVLATGTRAHHIVKEWSTGPCLHRAEILCSCSAITIVVQYGPGQV